MCNNCIHKAVCSKFAATGGYVRECEHFREERRGEWRKVYTCHGEQLWGYECSRCKGDSARGSYYCPNCGADMRGVEDGK